MHKEKTERPKYRLIIVNSNDETYRVIEGSRTELEAFPLADTELAYLVRDRREGG
jgi:hypothetical protein